MPFKPMLASPADFEILRFPLYASPKVDGLRCTVHDGVAMSRSMKPLPNKWLQAYFKAWAKEWQGLDGELVVGPPTAPDCYRKSTSFIMSHDKEHFDWRFYVFDRHDLATCSYAIRLKMLQTWPANESHPYLVSLLPAIRLESQAELDDYETSMLEQGFEGVMVRDPDGLYKQGRATARGQELLKVKRSADMEAVIIGAEEQMHNGNEAFTSELGRTKRSKVQSGLVDKGTLGALIVRGVNGPYKDVEFSVGTGFDDAERAAIWASRTLIIHGSQTVKIGYFPLGSKDKPRHPTWLGFRSLDDMDANL